MWLRSTVALGMLMFAACGGPGPDEPSEAAVPGSSEGAPAAATAANRAEPDPGALPRQPAPDGARVYLISPRDGERLENPVRVVFGLAGAGVAPAGVEQAGTGHHHLLVDTALEDPSLPIPADDRHIHFGGGQTETTLTLDPGEHTLQLVLGDHLHIPHDPPIVSEIVTIEVQP